jgi:hypothetical protein
MVDFIIAVGLILLLLIGWIFIQQLSRHYAQQHPQFGPPREEGSGCGKSCLCSNGNCKNKQQSLNNAQAHSNIKSEGSHS